MAYELIIIWHLKKKGNDSLDNDIKTVYDICGC